VQGRDSIAPDLTCPRDTTFECDDIGDAGTATATDNCDDSPEIIYSDNIVPGTGPGCYLIERTWIATDDCSNTDQCTQYITVVDTTPPVLTCAPDETISCGEAVAFTEPTASDNCDGDVRVDEPTDETVTWDPVTRELRYTMCWRVSDDCGNESEECCQTITVQGCTFVPLRITKDDGLAVPAAPGDTITYAITVYNDNPVAVTSVSVVDQLPARANFVAADHIFGYDPADHDVTWNLASIPGLGSVQLIVVAEVDRQIVSEDVVNIASASCPQVFGSVEAAETTRVESGRLEVYVDVRPGFCPNPVNPKGTGQVPVAVLGTNDLDVTDIDASTILLGREGVAGTLAPVSWSVADVAEPFTGELCDCHTDGADGYPDLVLKFSNTDLFTALNLSAVRGRYVELILTGDLLDETDIVGSDCVRVLGKAENPGLGIAASKPTGFTMGAQVGLSGSDLSLAFALAEAGHVGVDVFDVQGRLVTRLVDTEMDAGDHSVGWNLTDQFGKRVPLGIYFARLSTAQTHVTKKLVVVE